MNPRMVFMQFNHDGGLGYETKEQRQKNKDKRTKTKEQRQKIIEPRTKNQEARQKIKEQRQKKEIQ